jgi:hypothetical protein
VIGGADLNNRREAMKLIVCLCVALAAGCGMPLGVEQRAAVGDACSLSDCTWINISDGSNCPMDGRTLCRLDCPACGTGLTCSSAGVCGIQCGDGNEVCDPGTLCALRGTGDHDCLPQCTIAGATVYRPGTNCVARGLELEEATGKCFVPCFSDECVALGGDNYSGLPLRAYSAM